MMTRLVALTLICWFTFTELIYTLRPSQAHSGLMNLSSSHQSAVLQFTYEEIKSGRGITKDGIETSFSIYESSDGVEIFTRIEFFHSASDMKTQFETRAKGLSQILERTYMKKTPAERLESVIREERILGKNLPNEEGREWFSIMWDHDNKISYIESVSLNHILNFESQFYQTRK